jgi:hypothetical protein
MSDPNLTEETHTLLKQLLELEQEQRRQREEFKKKMDEHPIRRHLEDNDQKEFEEKMKKTREESRKNLEESQERNRVHQQNVLEELRKQTELLERIAARLEA